MMVRKELINFLKSNLKDFTVSQEEKAYLFSRSRANQKEKKNRINFNFRKFQDLKYPNYSL